MSMNEIEIEKIYKTVGKVVVKTSLIRFIVNNIKTDVEKERFSFLDDKVKELETIRSKFAHRIPLINSSIHPGEVFLSKEGRENPGWLSRLDGDRINELYNSFIQQYDELENEINNVIDGLKLKKNKPEVLRVIENLSGTTVIKGILSGPGVEKEGTNNAPSF